MITWELFHKRVKNFDAEFFKFFLRKLRLRKILTKQLSFVIFSGKITQKIACADFIRNKRRHFTRPPKIGSRDLHIALLLWCAKRKLVASRRLHFSELWEGVLDEEDSLEKKEYQVSAIIVFNKNVAYNMNGLTKDGRLNCSGFPDTKNQRQLQSRWLCKARTRAATYWSRTSCRNI